MVAKKSTRQRRGSPKAAYEPSEVESKWQKEWEKGGLYETSNAPKRKKYILDMFPYPSGDTLHVGHVEGYVGTDILSRFERMRGADVLHPMGWDAFGLPAENYAIKTGINPDQSTHNNIKIFKRQLTNTGMSYDWDHEIDTSSPEFYKWTQWLFILMYKRGLAYKKMADVNWCPSCETVLANEQVVEGKCERCGTEVVQKKLSQWFLKITKYADRLISGLDKIDWLEGVKVQQKNWIGRSEGAKVKFEVENDKAGQFISVFTTRPDTLFGATFMVIPPDSEWVEKLTTKGKKDAVSEYIKLETSRTNKVGEEKGKTGIFTGSFVINPATEEKIPVWIANYVVSGYGSGAVMGVPAHDARDFDFAKKYDLPIKWVIESTRGKANESEAYTGEGKIVNSQEWNGWTTPDSIGKVIEYLEKKGTGKKQVQYHLRDWLISRQRYWGAPIPMVYCPACAKKGLSWFTTSIGSDGAGNSKFEIRNSKTNKKNENLKFKIENSADWSAGWYPVPEDQLPVYLPKDVDFRPTGESPIARSKEFQEGVVCPNCGAKAKREVDTMDTYVDSSWYFIRFTDPKNTSEFASREAIKQWLPVDTYVGGGHVVQHLLFARFFWKVLFDAELLDESAGDEPFLKLRAPGWILGQDSRKMSKRWGNIVTPDDIIPKYGADTLRMYEMFMGPFDAVKPWNLTGVEGMWRFINRVWRLVVENDKVNLVEEKDQQEVVRVQHKTIQSVTKDIEELHFNTAIASLMEFVNLLQDKAQESTDHRLQSMAKKDAIVGRQRPASTRPASICVERASPIAGSQSTVDRIICAEWKDAIKALLLLLAPFAPYITEELWHQTGSESSIHLQPWPEFDPELIQEETVAIPVQVNGKFRGTIEVDQVQGRDQKEVETRARESVPKYLEGKKVNKVIFVPARLINFVVS